MVTVKSNGCSLDAFLLLDTSYEDVSITFVYILFYCDINDCVAVSITMFSLGCEII